MDHMLEEKYRWENEDNLKQRLHITDDVDHNAKELKVQKSKEADPHNTDENYHNFCVQRQN